MKLRLIALAGLMVVAAAAPKVKPVKLPAGPGQTLVQSKCAACHPLTMVTTKRKTQDEWDAALDQMTGKGLRLTDDEYELASAYLAKNFGVKR